MVLRYSTEYRCEVADTKIGAFLSDLFDDGGSAPFFGWNESGVFLIGRDVAYATRLVRCTTRAGYTIGVSEQRFGSAIRNSLSKIGVWLQRSKAGS